MFCKAFTNQHNVLNVEIRKNVSWCTFWGGGGGGENVKRTLTLNKIFWAAQSHKFF